MKIALLNTKDTLRARYLLECFTEGATLHGDECFWVTEYRGFEKKLENADLGIQVCFPNIHHNRVEQSEFRAGVNEVLHASGKRILTIDTGFLRNQSEHEMQVKLKTGQPFVFFDPDKRSTYEAVMPEIYYELGYDGLKNDAQYYNANVPGDRWAALRFPLKPWRRVGNHVLIVGQTMHGLSTQHINIYDWYADVYKSIRRHTSRPIVFRPHPRIVKVRRGRSRVEKDRQTVMSHLPTNARVTWSTGIRMKDDLQGAWASVVYSSNAAATSVVYGVPVFAGSSNCIAWPVADTDLAKIDTPALPDRTQWANSLAYAQWNCAELKRGDAWAHLRPHALKPPGSFT